MTNNKEILLYDIKKDDEEWIIYWIANSSTLGLTNYIERAYEIRLDTSERKKLMRNCAESLLENKWIRAFQQKALQITKIDGDLAQLKYVSQEVILPKVENVMVVLRKLFYHVYSMLQLSIERESTSQSPLKQTSNSPTKRTSTLQSNNELLGPKRRLMNPKLIGRRKPGALLMDGVKFDDVIEEKIIPTDEGTSTSEAEAIPIDISNISPMKA